MDVSSSNIVIILLSDFEMPAAQPWCSTLRRKADKTTDITHLSRVMQDDLSAFRMGQVPSRICLVANYVSWVDQWLKLDQ